MTQQVYTIGYSGRKMEEIEALVNDLGAVIFDVRFSPFSRAPQWSGSNFARVFGRRYAHVKAFGNANYKSGGPIELLDYQAGREAVAASGRPVILMCGCKDYQTCHRKTIAEMLRADGFEVEEIGAGDAQPRREQAQFDL